MTKLKRPEFSKARDTAAFKQGEAMAVIGIVSVVQFFFAIIAVAVTGRKEWLTTLLWSLTLFSMAYNVSENSVINGLVVIIAYYMFFMTSYSLWGIKLWHTGERRNRKLIFIFILTLNVIICSYYVYQFVNLGYFGKAFESLTKAQKAAVTAVFGSSVGIFMIPSSITAVDRFFSKREEFVLIHCSPVRSSKKNDVHQKRRYAIKGVQNGKEYVFCMTRKAFLLLKKREHFVMDSRRGVLGGVYVMGNIYKNENRRSKRIDKVLFRSGVLAFVLTLIAVLFLIKIKTQMSFGQLFEYIWKQLLAKIR